MGNAGHSQLQMTQEYILWPNSANEKSGEKKKIIKDTCQAW